MKHLVLLGIFTLFWSQFNRISEINARKAEAEICFQKKDYINAIRINQELLTTYNVSNDEVKLNLANSYFNLGRFNNSIDYYKMLTSASDREIKSMAYLQLGVVYGRYKKKEIALSYFREALKAQPENELARYNYELLKKDHERQQQYPDKRNENSKGENQMNTTSKDDYQKSKQNTTGNNNPEDITDEGSGDEETGEGSSNDNLQPDGESDQETDALTSQRLAEVHMSERQARMILKSMKTAEIQYLQQRKKISTVKRLPGKPDW